MPHTNSSTSASNWQDDLDAFLSSIIANKNRLQMISVGRKRRQIDLSLQR